MKLVIPMAGRGRRFLDAGIGTPKMLLPVRGRLMIDWALAGLSFIEKKDIIFIILREHDLEFGLSRTLQKHFGSKAKVHIIDGITKGQACTVAEAQHLYAPSEPLIIFNTDTYFHSPSIETSLKNLGESCDGVIGAFRSKSTDYSYARVSTDGLVRQVAEKKVISEWATSGLYAFARASDFLSALEDAIKEGDFTGGEYYVGPLYNRLIAKGARIKLDCCTEIYDFGTPEKLERFKKIDLR